MGQYNSTLKSLFINESYKEPIIQTEPCNTIDIIDINNQINNQINNPMDEIIMEPMDEIIMEKKFMDMKEPLYPDMSNNVVMMDAKKRALRNLNNILQKQISDKKQKLSKLNSLIDNKTFDLTLIIEKLDKMTNEYYQKQEILSEYNYNMKRKINNKRATQSLS